MVPSSSPVPAPKAGATSTIIKFAPDCSGKCPKPPKKKCKHGKGKGRGRGRKDKEDPESDDEDDRDEEEEEEDYSKDFDKEFKKDFEREGETYPWGKKNKGPKKCNKKPKKPSCCYNGE